MNLKDIQEYGWDSSDDNLVIKYKEVPKNFQDADMCLSELIERWMDA